MPERPPIEAGIPEEIDIDQRNVQRLRDMLNDDGIPRDPEAFRILIDSMLGHQNLPPEQAEEEQYQAIKGDLLAMASGSLAAPETILNHAMFLLGMVERDRV